MNVDRNEQDAPPEAAPSHQELQAGAMGGEPAPTGADAEAHPEATEARAAEQEAGDAEQGAGEAEQEAGEAEQEAGDAEQASGPPAPPPAPDEPPVVEPEHPRLRRHPVAPATIALDRIDDDLSLQIRPSGDLSLLATDIARLGQLFPVDVRLIAPDRFQVICGFRRVAALRFLQRDRVLARLHTDLSDEEALLMALVSAIHAAPVEAEELEQVRDRLEAQGRLTPSIRSMLEKALSSDDGLAPETVGEEEIDADELAQDVTVRLGELNQDLSLLAEAFDALDRTRQDQLLEQLRYSSELVSYLEGRR